MWVNSHGSKRTRFDAFVAAYTVCNSKSHDTAVFITFNVVSNAISYTDEGTVSLRVIDEDSILRIEVKDTGIGIPPEDLPRVFDDFFRASNVEARGTGLGLSITRRIVEAHGGKIWVESPDPESNNGSRFTFTVPLATSGEPNTEERNGR